MIVLKFGGTSIGSVDKIRDVAKLVSNVEPKIVVLSAMSGTTNELVKITNCLYKRKVKEAHSLIDNLEEKYLNLVNELFLSASYREKGRKLILFHFNDIKNYAQDLFTSFRSEEHTSELQSRPHLVCRLL